MPPSTGQADPFTPRLDGDRLYGRGACDTKGWLATMVHAAEAVQRAGETVSPHHWWASSWAMKYSGNETNAAGSFDQFGVDAGSGPTARPSD